VQPRENASPALILKRSAGTSRERAARFERIRDRREGNFQLEQARASRTKDVDKYQTYKSQGACSTGGRGGRAGRGSSFARGREKSQVTRGRGCKTRGSERANDNRQREMINLRSAFRNADVPRWRCSAPGWISDRARYPAIYFMPKVSRASADFNGNAES